MGRRASALEMDAQLRPPVIPIPNLVHKQGSSFDAYPNVVIPSPGETGTKGSGLDAYPNVVIASPGATGKRDLHFLPPESPPGTSAFRA
jgi:hypothetical protein